MQRTDPTIVAPDATLRAVMTALDQARVQIVLVAGDDRRLLGSITDGDIRRALLGGATLETPARDAMNRSPLTLPASSTRDATIALMRRRGVFQLPLLDERQRIVSVALLSDPRASDPSDVPVVLMAGGLGKRLRPLTEDTPKPMLAVGGRPLLERIIERLRDQGFSSFFVSVNYLGHQIEDYFGDGEHLDVSISYLRETKQLGTGGAINLLPLPGIEHVAVMNGDIITDLFLPDMVEHHRSRGFAATMCVRQHRTTVPYGVVEFDGDRFRATTEKPTVVHHINSGIYVLSRRAIEAIPTDTFYDLPSLFTTLAGRSEPCGVFPLSDLWFDIGSPEDLERARRLLAEEAGVADVPDLRHVGVQRP